MMLVRYPERATLRFLQKYMSRFLLHSRRVMGASIVVLLMVIVALSTATRQPGLEVSTGPWHTWKAGHMTTVEGQETSETRSTASSEKPGECSGGSAAGILILRFCGSSLSRRFLDRHSDPTTSSPPYPRLTSSFFDSFGRLRCLPAIAFRVTR